MKKTVVLLAAALLAFSCQKQEPTPPTPPTPSSNITIPAESQDVFKNGITFPAPAAGGQAQQTQSQTVSFTAAKPWTTTIAETKAISWLTVEPASGAAGAVTMKVTAQPNDTYDDRSATVTIKSGDSSSSFTVRQAGKARPVEVTGISLNKETLELYEGASEQLTATVTPDNASDKTVTWSSSDDAIATVDANGIITAIKAGTAKITAKAGEKTATCDVTVKANVIPVSAVTLDKTSIEMTEGDSETITATVSPDNASNKTVTWSSSDTSIATVDESGKVTAVKAGTATITAKADDKTATCTVTVKAKVIPVSSVSLNKTSLELTEGDSETLTATVSPDNASNKTITWSSSDTSIATVDESGKVTAVKAGTATITATAGDKSATCTVTVKAKVIPVSSVNLNKTSLELTEGDSETLTATVNPDNATDKTVSWSTSDGSIATVDASGKVTAVKAGTATITASAGGKSATCTVTVKAKVIPVTSVSLNKASLDLTEGESETLTATVNPDNATDKTVTWSTSDGSIATVDASGKVTAVKAGTATITAKAGDKSATCTVTVKAKVIPVTSVSLNKASLDLTEGDSETLTATVSPDNATDKTVSWSTSDGSIATVDASGKVTAVKAGTATITASAGGKSATCTVTVKAKVIPVSSVSLNKASLELTEGDSETLTATVSPDNATDKTVTWSTSDGSIATVDASGKVTAVKAGTATITASAGGKSATCIVKVAAAVPPGGSEGIGEETWK